MNSKLSFHFASGFLLKTPSPEHGTSSNNLSAVFSKRLIVLEESMIRVSIFDEAALRAVVKERIAALGMTDPKQTGRLIGDIMKTHKGQAEANEIKRIAEEFLSLK